MARRQNQQSPTGCILGGILIAVVGGGFCFWAREQFQATYKKLGVNNTMDQWVWMGLVCIAIGICFVVYGAYLSRKIKALHKSIKNMADDSEGANAEDFLKRRGYLKSDGDFTGIYILHNVTKDQYYVGQSVRVIGRVTQHLTGHGNGDVYADFKYGDEFTVKTISLVDSGYQSIDALERHAIDTYHAFNLGYNRTRGNQN